MMGKDLHIVDQIFLKGVETYEENPPDGTWQTIESKLDKQHIRRAKKRFYIYSAAAVLALLLLLGLGIYNIHKESHNNRIATNGNAGLSKSQVISPEKRNGEKREKVYTAPLTSTPSQYASATKLRYQAQEINPVPYNKTHHLIVKHYSAGKSYTSIGEMNAQLPPIIIKANIAESKLGKDTDFNAKPIKCLTLTSIYSENKNAPKYSYHNGNNNIILPKQKSTHKEVFSRISLTIMFSPDINGYALRNNETGNNQSTGDLRSKEQEGFSYSGGILADFNINNKWALESGITLTNTVLSISPSTIYAQMDNSGKVGYILPTTTGYSKIPDISNSNLQVGDSLELTSNSTQRLRYISLPLILKYHIKKDRFTFQCYSGVGLNFLSKSATDVSFQTGNVQLNEAIDTIQGLKGAYLSGLVGIGAQYDLTKRVKISFSPTLKYSITSINQNTPVRKYPYSIGLWAGITYQF